MDMQLSRMRTRVEQLKGIKQQLTTTHTEIEENLRYNNKQKRRIEQALEIVKLVGLKTQQNLQFHISDISTMALDSVFDRSYLLSAEFVERRGRTECDLLLKTEDMELDPLSASGGGVVDVVSFALRVAAYSLQRPKVRPVLLLDEPFTHLSAQLFPKACNLLKQISEELGIQLIIITHEEALMDCADKVFQISLRKGVSRIKCEK
jgi:DNA repair exonuclease SbcCD ATPase subunit